MAVFRLLGLVPAVHCATHEEGAMIHRHTFALVDKLHRRYRCECGVYGYRHGTKLVPMTCSLKLDVHTRCGEEAVVVNGERNHSRCSAHS
jgi:hypothetical protein